MFKCFLEYILDRSIFDLMEEIPKIEDASVQDIFQEAFEHLLSYCCQSDETLDLTLDTRNAKSHVISCFRQLCENNLIKQRLANQDKKFIFSNYDSGLKQSKQISKRMGKACLCDECLKSNKINLVNFKSDSFHVALKNIVLLIEQDKFQEAKALIEKLPNENNKYLTADKVFRSVYYKIYDKYGILREFAEDPLWANLSEDAKKEAGSNPELAKKINMGFLKRRLEAKNKLSAKKTEAESKINEPIQSCMPEIKQENIPHAISQIKDQEQIPACAETGKEDLKTCGGASIKGAKSDIPVEVQEAKSDESSTKLKEVFGEPEIPAQKIEPESSAPECNSSKQRNVPDLVGEDVADKVAVEAEKESVEQKSETPEVDSEQEFKPAIKADEENTAGQDLEAREKFAKHIAKVINDIKHNPELEVKLEELKKLAEEFNNSEEAKSLGIWIDYKKLFYHILHGDIRNGRITGFHFKDSDHCCFEFDAKYCNSDGICFGRVKMKDPELRKYIEDKPSTTVFGAGWDVKRILDEVKEAIREKRVNQDYIKKN